MKDDDVKNVAEFANGVTEEALEKMQYLHVPLTETLRLFPAAPVDAKIWFADDVLPDGYDVKEWDMVSYQTYAMESMKFLVGDDAEDFKPERLADNVCFQPESPFKFYDFSGRTKNLSGPEICV